MGFLSFAIGLLPAALNYFKINPRRAAHLIVAAIGYLTVGTQVLEQVVLPVMYQAISFLKQVADALNVL